MPVLVLDARLASQILPLSFSIAPATPRPRVELYHQDGAQHWDV